MLILIHRSNHRAKPAFMNKIHSPIPVFFLLIVFSSANGQSNATHGYASATLLENSSMSITGNSTLHGWNVDAKKYSVRFQVPESWFESVKNWSGEDVEELTVNVPVEHLDGGKNKMNKDLREALKFEDYPEIVFRWDSINFVGETDMGRKAEVTGRLKIAGVEREVSFQTYIYLNEWFRIVAKGKVPVNMVDYGIEPPSALFGLIKTDGSVEIVYELYFAADS